MEPLPVTATSSQYEAQAADLLRGHAERDPKALELIHNYHPKFLHTEVRWLPLPLSAEDIALAPFDAEDARLTLARWYSFQDWQALTTLVEAVESRDPEVYPFETAAEAVITGDLDGLATLLRSNPQLVHARSSRVTCFDPPAHRATLLHYVAANGVENHRQRTPSNAVMMARALLENGADPNATADMYGGECSPLSMLVSSSPPAAAGVQPQLIATLLDYGADPDERGSGNWTSPLMTALLFGFDDAARMLVERGAKNDRLALAAGLGRRSEVEALLADADALERHRAFSLAALAGHVEVVRFLLDAGESPDRFNPTGMHAHATPLHQAALGGREAMVRLLVERGARLDIPDKYWNSTPQGWAAYAGHQELAEYLGRAVKETD